MTRTLAAIFAFTLSASLALPLYAGTEPYLVGPKVEADLEKALTRLIPLEQFLVQASAEVAMTTQRRLIEGETVISGTKAEEEAKPKQVMPGFLPESEPTTKAARPNEQTRQVFRMVDSPELKAVRVNVSFDENLAQNTILKAKSLVTNYLSSSYPNQAFVTFNLLPMLKPKLTERELDSLEAKKRAAELQPWEKFLSQYGVWMIAALAAIILLLLMRRRENSQPQPMFYPPQPQPPRPARKKSTEDTLKEILTQPGGMRGKISQAFAPAKPAEGESEEAMLQKLRKRFLQMILSRSDAFRMWYERLNSDERDELYLGLRGPAFDNFLDGLGIERKKEADLPTSSPDLQEKLESHERTFIEFCDAKNWQDRQFFGFLHRLSDEQLMSLVNDEKPEAVGVMLRFMKANQSAFVLDTLPADERAEVLTHATSLHRMPFSAIMAVEKEVRAIVDKMPGALFTSPQEDVEYWGSVLSESTDQEGILGDMEKTHPEIYPDLKKFRFKLDDAPSISAAVVKKVLADADNEELGLALMTCSQSTADFLMDALSPRRRQFLEDSWDSFRNADKAQTVEARLQLTKRFREALV